jgi:hypothetical protein
MYEYDEYADPRQEALEDIRMELALAREQQRETHHVILFWGFIAFAYFAGWFASSSFQLALVVAGACGALLLIGWLVWLICRSFGREPVAVTGLAIVIGLCIWTLMVS